MKTEFRKSFVKDLQRQVKDKKLLGYVQKVIQEVEAAKDTLKINNLKKLTPKSCIRLSTETGKTGAEARRQAIFSAGVVVLR